MALSFILFFSDIEEMKESIGKETKQKKRYPGL